MTATDRAVELARAAAAAAQDKQAEQVIGFDVSEQLVITDIFVLCSGNSQPQINAIRDSVEEKLLALDAKPIRREGERDGRWVLLDYGDVVVHIQHAEERSFYSLERLWSDCPVVAL